jgi:hypothetical protein
MEVHPPPHLGLTDTILSGNLTRGASLNMVEAVKFVARQRWYTHVDYSLSV